MQGLHQTLAGWDAPGMGKVGTAWAEDRWQLLATLLPLTAGVLLAIANWDSPALLTLTVLIFGGGAIRQAVDVLVYRPRRLARTGDRAGRGFWS